MIIEDNERSLARMGMKTALECGADGVRVNLNKSISDTYISLDGEIDKVSRCSDRSLTFSIFRDSRFGTFSTNRLDENSVRDFVRKACETVGMMEPDGCRRLPSAERLAKDAVSGLEAGLWDEGYSKMTDGDRIEVAKSMALRCREGNGWKAVSEEDEYTDYIDETYQIDSQGFEGQHFETGFSCSSEVTIADASGRRYSSYWWDASAMRSGIDPEGCSRKALERAVASMDPSPVEGGRYRMVVDGNVGSKLLNPIINALNASGIQQKMSFLCESKGRKIFSEGLTLKDLPREKGKAGARLFDSEGVATRNRDIIENGVVKNYFVNTFMANKTGEEPTVEDISRPVLKSWISPKFCSAARVDEVKGWQSGEKCLTLEDILRFCGDGIFVNEFNGGNCNSVTGDYSFGVSGFRIEGGKIGRPFSEMLITGNMIELWNSLLAVGNDARECGRWRIPTTAFGSVMFSA